MHCHPARPSGPVRGETDILTFPRSGSAKATCGPVAGDHPGGQVAVQPSADIIGLDEERRFRELIRLVEGRPPTV